MLSFVKLASIAAFAFGTLVSASAVLTAEKAVPAVLVPPTIIVHVAPAPETALYQRDELSSIAAIIGNLTAALEPVLKDLSGLSSANITSIEKLVGDISTLIKSATSAISSLSGQSLDSILSSLDGGSTLGIGDIASLLGGLLTDIFNAISLATSGSTDSTSIINVITSLVKDIEPLLAAIISVSGLPGASIIVALLPLIVDILPALLKLIIPAILSLL